MSRVILAAAAIFAGAALVLQKTLFAGPFTEPALLLTMGSLFLLASRYYAGNDRRAMARASQGAPLAPARQRATV